MDILLFTNGTCNYIAAYRRQYGATALTILHRQQIQPQPQPFLYFEWDWATAWSQGGTIPSHLDTILHFPTQYYYCITAGNFVSMTSKTLLKISYLWQKKPPFMVSNRLFHSSLYLEAFYKVMYVYMYEQNLQEQNEISYNLSHLCLWWVSITCIILMFSIGSVVLSTEMWMAKPVN